MLFQGQEFASSSKFLFFADHKPELAEKVRQGRAEFLGQWRSLVMPEMKKCFDDPSSPATFENSKIDHSEVVEARRNLQTSSRSAAAATRGSRSFTQGGDKGVDGAVLNPQCFVLRYFSDGFKDDRLLVVNLGTDLEFNPAPEPLLAPPAARQWLKLWSSDDPQYGGCGTAVLDSEENWQIPGMAAVVLHPVPPKLLDFNLSCRHFPRMNEIYRHTAKAPLTPEENRLLTETEWLVTNGLGGYATGTLGGTPTRVFHSYLVAALPSPKGRTMMLNDMLETVVFPNGDKFHA